MNLTHAPLKDLACVHATHFSECSASNICSKLVLQILVRYFKFPQKLQTCKLEIKDLLCHLFLATSPSHFEINSDT